MHEKLFSWISRVTTQNPVKILLVVGLITIVMLYSASMLELELSWVGLAPEGDPSQAEYNKILDKFPSASNIYIMVSNNQGSPETAAKLAAQRLNQLDKYVGNVNYKTNSDFLLDNMLLLSKESDTKNIVPLLKDANLTGVLKNLNNVYEREYKGNSGNINNNKKQLKRTLRGIKQFLQYSNNALAQQEYDKAEDNIKQLLTGDPYFRSKKGDHLLVTVQPGFSLVNYNQLKTGVNAIESELKMLEKNNPGFDYGLTGMHVVGRDEMKSSTRDSTISMIIGLALVLLILITAFKMWISPLLAAVPLILGIIWDMGLAAVTVGRLNILTIFTAAILIGLGIDFSVHILSGYTEARSEGKTSFEAAQYTLNKVGPGILTGALTTSAAFFTLTISSLGFLVELGIIMGLGILTTVLAVFFTLPALLVVKEEKLGLKSHPRKGKYKFIGNTAQWVSGKKLIVIGLVIAAVLFMGWQGSKIDLYLNLEKIEPKGLESMEVMNEISEKFGMSNDSIMFTTQDLNKTHKLVSDLRDQSEIEAVRSITDYLPPQNIQQKRINNLNKIEQIINNQPDYHQINKNKLIVQLKRLQNNLIEIGQLSFMSGNTDIVAITDSITGTPDNSGVLTELIKGIENSEFSDKAINNYGQIFYEYYSDYTVKMQVEDKITKKNLPQSIRDQYISKDGSTYLTQIHASGNLWQRIKKPYGKRFIQMIKQKVPRATGVPLFMRVLYDQTKKEVPRALVLITITLFLLLLVHFRSIKQAIIGFLPLTASLILTLGLLKILGVNLDIFSVLAFPLIVGIGIDDGVHVIHRYNHSDGSLNQVFSSVGRAILLTSLTTMASFGSLMVAKYQGIFRLGATLFIGVGFCFVMTIALLPIFMKRK